MTLHSVVSKFLLFRVSTLWGAYQNAAEQYLNEIKALRDQTEAERQKILAQAHAAADAIIAGANKARSNYDSAIDEIMKEYGQSHSDIG